MLIYAIAYGTYWRGNYHRFVRNGMEFDCLMLIDRKVSHISKKGIKTKSNGRTLISRVL